MLLILHCKQLSPWVLASSTWPSFLGLSGNGPQFGYWVVAFPAAELWAFPRGTWPTTSPCILGGLSGLWKLSSGFPSEYKQVFAAATADLYLHFELPLNNVVYTWIDNLSDPEFPPCDGKKPSSWRPINEITAYVQRPLNRLTKGLLETTSMDPRYPQDNGKQEFFQATARDFLLENSKLDDIRRKYPILTGAETYYRLWLAETTFLLDVLTGIFSLIYLIEGCSTGNFPWGS